MNAIVVVDRKDSGVRRRFDPTEVENDIELALRVHLEDKIYDRMAAPRWVQAITDQVHDQIVKMSYYRYKFIVSVTLMDITEKDDTNFASLCVWDSETDFFAQCTFKNNTIACYAVVYGVYKY